MAHLTFTQNIQRHIKCPVCEAGGATVREVMDAVFASNETARGYVLDDAGALRRHMIIFVNGRAIVDRISLSDPVPDEAEVYIMQALSGG